MKSVTLLAIAAALILLTTFNFALGQSNQTSYTVRLNSFTLQVTYPAEVMPGDTITIYVQGSPTGSAVYLQSLTVTIYYADATGLRQVSTQNLFTSYSPNSYNNYVTYGYSGSFSKNFTVTVPENAPRTALVALFSETVQPNYYSYGGYGYNYPSYASYPYYPSYSVYVSPAYYPYSSYSYSSDQGIASLSYINANTPETVTLQSQNQLLQQQLSQLQAQNQELQSKVTDQSATINQLTQQLASMNGTVQAYQMIGLTLGVVIVLLLAFSFNRRKLSRTKPQVETKAAA